MLFIFNQDFIIKLYNSLVEMFPLLPTCIMGGQGFCTFYLFLYSQQLQGFLIIGAQLVFAEDTFGSMKDVVKYFDFIKV